MSRGPVRYKRSVGVVLTEAQYDKLKRIVAGRKGGMGTFLREYVESLPDPGEPVRLVPDRGESSPAQPVRLVPARDDKPDPVAQARAAIERLAAKAPVRAHDQRCQCLRCNLQRKAGTL